MSRDSSIMADALFALDGNTLESINIIAPAGSENSTTNTKSELKPSNVYRLKISSR